MTKKDFHLIAATIDCAPLNYEARKTLAKEFAHVLERANPRFDRARFLLACGVTPLDRARAPTPQDGARRANDCRTG